MGPMSFVTCAVCLCNICACSSCLKCLFICLSLSGHHVCLSVTKRHKAHLKRLDRRWTLGGVISRQQSRGELRQMLHHLPSLFLHPFVIVLLTHVLFIASYHTVIWLNSSLGRTHILAQSLIPFCPPANTVNMSHNPP